MLAKQCLLTKTKLWESVTISQAVVVIEVIPPLQLLECTPSFLACKKTTEMNFLKFVGKLEGCVKERQLSHLILFQIFKIPKKLFSPQLAVKNRSIPLCLNQSFGFLEPFNPRVPKTACLRIQSGPAWFAALKSFFPYFASSLEWLKDITYSLPHCTQVMWLSQEPMPVLFFLIYDIYGIF